MNFPHNQPVAASSKPVSLRKLDIDILRVLAFSPAVTRGQRFKAAPSGAGRQAALIALFAGQGHAGQGHAGQVAAGSFNPHFASVLAGYDAVEQHGETRVYQSASANRKVARLIPSHAENYTSQAF